MLRQITLSLLFIIGTLLTFAQPMDQSELQNRIKALIKNGAYDSAQVFVTQILEKDSLVPNARQWNYQLLRNRKKQKEAYRVAIANRDILWSEASPEKRLELALNKMEAAKILEGSPKAEPLLKEVRNLREALPDLSIDLQIYFHYCEGIYHFGLTGGMTPDAGSAFLKTLTLIQESTDPDPYIWNHTLRHLGILSQSRGDYEQSVSYFQKLLEVALQFFNPSHFEVGVAHYNLGNTYYHAMEYQNALDHYLPAYAIWKDHYKPTQKYMRYLTEAIGDMYWELGQKDKALPYYNLSAEGKNNQVENSELARSRLADSLLTKDKYEEAMNNYDQALAFRKKIYGEKHAMTGSCQNQIARAYRTKGNYEKALDAYQEAMIMLVKDFQDTLLIANPNLEMEIISEQNLLESLSGKFYTLELIYQQSRSPEDLQLAFATAQQAIALLDQLRQSALSEKSLVFWGQKYYPIFGKALGLAYQLYPESEDFVKIAFPIIESSKTIVLQNALYVDQNITRFNIPEALIQREKELQKNIHEYQARIENEEQNCERAQVNKIELWRAELFDQKLAYNTFTNQIREDYPQYHDLKFGRKAITITNLRKQVLTDEEKAMIIYFEAEPFFYSIGLSQEGYFHHRSPNNASTQKQLDSLLHHFYDIDHALQNPQKSYRDFTRQSHQWYQKLISPIEQQLPSTIQQLYLIPDHHLYYLPFAALVTQPENASSGDYRKLPYLLHDYQISYSQSASVLLYSSGKKEEGKYAYNYTGFAPENFASNLSLNPLRWNQEEVTQAADGWHGQSFIGPNATKAAFLKSSQQSQVLHLATHARVDDAEPMSSTIFFQAEKETEGILQAYELYATPLQSELVVLSACNTTIGKWERGEGMISLERAFQYAGCPALLTSTWSIDDQTTAHLNHYFFEFLKEGNNKAAALQQAKQQYLKEADPAHRHPFFWSGLRLTGNPEALSGTLQNQKKIWMGIGVMAFLFLTGFIFFSSKTIQ